MNGLVRRMFAVIGVALSAWAAAAHACNVPVFRFALERWSADAYRVVVFHDQPLSSAQRAWLRPWEELPSKQSANFSLRIVDVRVVAAATTEQAAADRAFLAEMRNASFPGLVVQYPEQLGIARPVWAGPLTAEALPLVTDSPARQVLARRLASGQTAVWLFVESGDERRDAEAHQLLVDELSRLEQSLELPKLTAAPEDALVTPLPLEVKFSVLRLSRSDDAERTLIAMLINCEPDLVNSLEPLAFPVFGRGRALWPLVGAGISAQNIDEAASFLVSACSCEVKEQNPGFDLLLTADWDTLLPASGLSPVARETRPKSPSGEPEYLTIPRGSAGDAPATAAPSGLDESGGRNVLILGSSLIAALLLAALLLASRLLNPAGS